MLSLSLWQYLQVFNEVDHLCRVGDQGWHSKSDVDKLCVGPLQQEMMGQS